MFSLIKKWFTRNRPNIKDSNFDVVKYRNNVLIDPEAVGFTLPPKLSSKQTDESNTKKSDDVSTNRNMSCVDNSIFYDSGYSDSGCCDGGCGGCD